MSGTNRGRIYSPRRLWRGKPHERANRLCHGTREDEGRSADGRHLRSRDDGPRAQPDDPVHHGTGTAKAPAHRGRRDGSPDVRAQLRHARRLLGRPPRWIPSREAHGSDVHLAEQYLPPLRRLASAHNGPPGTSPVRASDHRGLRAQSPGNPDVHVPGDLVRHVPSSPRGSRPQRPIHLDGPPPDADGTGLLRGGHPARFRRPRLQPRGVRALSDFLHLARSDRPALATSRSEMRRIDRMAELGPEPLGGGGPPEGFVPPTCSLRNCRCAGLSYVDMSTIAFLPRAGPGVHPHTAVATEAPRAGRAPKLYT